MQDKADIGERYRRRAEEVRTTADRKSDREERKKSIADILETDKEGNFATRPVMGWVAAPAAGMAVTLRLQYAEKPGELRTGGRWLRTVLTLQQAVKLADVLRRSALERVCQLPTCEDDGRGGDPRLLSDVKGADLEDSHGREAALCRQSFKVISDG
jgi:hypothetical protein